MRKSIILISAGCVAVLTAAYVGETASEAAATHSKDSASSGSKAPLLAEDFPAPAEGFIVTTLLIVADVDRSRDFYVRVFGAKIVSKATRPSCVSATAG